MYKVFINKNVVILTSQVPINTDVKLFNLKSICFKDIISNAKKFKKIYLFHKNPEKLIKRFKKKIKVVKAGGGVVRNANDETLFIYRRNKWDLPKGKKDKGECIEDTAIREVEEETGVRNLMISNFLMKTFHIFKKQNKYFLKETSWFNMTTKYDGELSPQINEGISKVVWKNKLKLSRIENTFPNIKLILDQIKNQLN
jgi:8-oxo-(d)GTP phosphatase